MGGPFAPRVALLGGKPTVDVDVPVCSVFLALFLGFGVSHMVVFRRNLSRGHKFIPSAVTFGFCMSRVVASIIRIAWACHPTNVRLAIAAQIFVAAGVLLLFILNLLYSQRMLRAALPRIGWSRAVSYAFKVFYVLVVLTIIMVITCVIQSMYTLNTNTLRIDRDIQLYGATYFAIVAFLPLPITLLVLFFARGRDFEHPGSGTWAAKGCIVIFAAVLLCLGASFRAGTTWMPPRPATNPPWYDHKACFYVFNFGIDLSVVALFLIARVDRRFWVPNGSSAVRHYRGAETEQKEPSSTQADERDIESCVGPSPVSFSSVQHEK
ncbi:Protein of unknown function DUF3112 [Penicillium argentinense]|uniref:Uncharacterized protein n=1 Tax=Penicillium argentinense TaxID=1131581 RepID=A0A9W9FCY4_9EURO|nr:Protein of unknown function DUF3112 [Penicillium argentinense]KAJ5097940.1 Protein of unknown function DUF3112 [Penicillium argentinense]